MTAQAPHQECESQSLFLAGVREILSTVSFFLLYTVIITQLERTQMKETLWLPWRSKPVLAKKRWVANVRLGTILPVSPLESSYNRLLTCRRPRRNVAEKEVRSQLHWLSARETPCFEDKIAPLMPTVQATEPTQIMLGIQLKNKSKEVLFFVLNGL